MRNNFDLEKAEFSDGSEDQLHIPTKQKLDMYNQQYCFLLQEVKKFFAHCKDCISRLISINSMGFGFNLPFMLTTMMCIENKWQNSPRNSQLRTESSQNTDKKYQKSFYVILQRMSGLIGDLLELQIDIKKNYMGIDIQTPRKILKRQLSFAERASHNSSQSHTSSQLMKKTIKKSIIEEEEQKDKQHEQKIRGILQEHLRIAETASNTVCKLKNEPLHNLQILTSKVEQIKQKICAQKRKQQKTWQTFNKKKPSSHKPQIKHILTKNKAPTIDINLLANDISAQFDEASSTNTKNTARKKSTSITCI